jgi:hypothetical protein
MASSLYEELDRRKKRIEELEEELYGKTSPPKWGWWAIGMILIILVIFLLTHACAFGFGKAYQKKYYKCPEPTQIQCMKFWPSICEPKCK